jgi:DedD protein
MGLLSLFKQKQETSEDTDSGEFRSRSEEESVAARSGKKRKPAQNARKDKTDDVALPEKKRARRRLIGALALVLAAVIGLPMLLDPEPKPLPDDISIQIPSKDKPLPASAAANSAGVAVDERKVNSLDAAEEMIDTAASDAKPVILPALSKLPAVKNNITTPPATVAPKKESVVTAKAEQKTPAAQTKADSPSEAKSVAVAAAKASQKAQHPEGKSGSVDSAKNQTDASDEASRALSILEGKAPAKAAVKPEVAEKTEKTASSHYVVQVAALASQDKVSELQAKLNAGGVKSYTQKVATASGEKIRVRLGPFNSKEDAEKAREKLVKLGLNGTLVPN